MKLQEKKDKEARMLQREALAAKQRQLKREKKSKMTEVTGWLNIRLFRNSNST